MKIGDKIKIKHGLYEGKIARVIETDDTVGDEGVFVEMANGVRTWLCNDVEEDEERDFEPVTSSDIETALPGDTVVDNKGDERYIYEVGVNTFLPGGVPFGEIPHRWVSFTEASYWSVKTLEQWTAEQCGECGQLKVEEKECEHCVNEPSGECGEGVKEYGIDVIQEWGEGSWQSYVGNASKIAIDGTRYSIDQIIKSTPSEEDNQ